MRGREILDRVKRLSGEHRWADFTEINNAYRLLMVRAGTELGKVRDEQSVAFEDGVKLYTLPMQKIRRLDSVWVKATDGQQEWRQMDQLSDEQFEALVFLNRTTSGTDAENTPSGYRIHGGEVDQLEISPVSDGTYPVRLVYLGEAPDLDDDNIPMLPGSYHWMIANLAAAEVLEYSEDEIKHAKARKLRGAVNDQHSALARDMAPNRAGVNFSRRRIIRA